MEVLLASIPIRIYHPRDGLIPPAPKSSTDSVRRWLTNSYVFFSNFREFSPALHKLCFFKGRSPYITVRLLQRDDDYLFANVYLDTSKVKAPMRIIKNHPNNRFVLQHFKQKSVSCKLHLKRPASSAPKRPSTAKVPPSPCGFIDCDGSCSPVSQENRKQFTMDSLLDECALKGVMASEAAVSENYERNTSLECRFGPRDQLSQLPPDVMHIIAKWCYRSDLRALARTNRWNQLVLRHFIPGLKLKLYPHQCAALDRMIEMEKRHKRKPLPMLHMVKKLEDCFIVADLVDGSLYSVTNIPTSDPAPRGGFLCDEPGLGKSITGISLILKTMDVCTHPPPGVEEQRELRQHEGENRSVSYYFENSMSDIQAGADAGLKMGPKRSTRIMSEINSNDEATRAHALQLAMEIEKPVSLRSRTVKPPAPPRPILLSSATVIFAPRELIPHWKEQIEKHTNYGSIRLGVITDLKKFPSAITLALEFDVILMSFNALSSMYHRVHEKGEITHPMVNIRFLRVIFDEGHKLGAGTQFHDACLSVRAERRWIMTGTPLRNTPNLDCEQLFSTLRFLRESNFGLDHDTWANAIRKPYSEFRACGLDTLKELLNSTMIRTNKKSIADIPSVKIKTVRLGFSDASATAYNALNRLVTRNLVTSDWFSEHHDQSMLNKAHTFLLNGVIQNLRKACNTGLSFAMQVNRFDLMCSLEKLFYFAMTKKHGRLGGIRPIDRVVTLCDEFGRSQPVNESTVRTHSNISDLPNIKPELCGTIEDVRALNEPRSKFKFPSKTHKHWSVLVEYRGILAEISKFMKKGGACDKCTKFAKEPFIAPCGHVLCSECMLTDRTSCPVCTIPYELDAFGVPEELIELQPSIVNLRQGWASSWEAGKDSDKMKYLLGKLHKMHQWNLNHPKELPKKAILFSGFSEHLMCASIALKTDSTLSQCYAELYTNFADITVNKSRIHEHFDKELNRFRENPKCSILLLGDRRGSVGLDLSFVQHVYLMEPVWDASLESQVIARAHRLGAKRTVYVERLVLKGSIEEDILASCKTVGNDRKTKKELEESRKRNIILNLRSVQSSPVTPANDDDIDDLVIDTLEDDQPMPRDGVVTPLRVAFTERVRTTSPNETKEKKKRKRKSGDHLAQLWSSNTRRRIRF